MFTYKLNNFNTGRLTMIVCICEWGYVNKFVIHLALWVRNPYWSLTFLRHLRLSMEELWILHEFSALTYWNRRAQHLRITCCWLRHRRSSVERIADVSRRNDHFPFTRVLVRTVGSGLHVLSFLTRDSPSLQQYWAVTCDDMWLVCDVATSSVKFDVFRSGSAGGDFCCL